MNLEQSKESERQIENLLNIIIETKRLLLKPVSLKYKEFVFSELTNDITKFMHLSTPTQIKDTETIIKKSEENMKKGTDLVISIFNKETNDFLGGGGIHHIDTKTPELGIWIKKLAHGNKYGQEAVAGLKKWADDNLDYNYLLYPVVKENIASRKIPEFLGGKIEREFIGKKENGEDVEEVEYRIYRND